MDYFGWSLGAGLFTGDARWHVAMELDSSDTREFEPDITGWNQVFGRVQDVLESAGLTRMMGTALHLSPNIPSLLVNLGMDEYFRRALAIFRERLPVSICMHARHDDDQLVNTPKFQDVFEQDVHLASLFGATTLVEHPPVGTRDTTGETVKVVTSPWFQEVLDRHPAITIAWENKADFASKRRFFGSLARMNKLRNSIVDGLEDIGRGDLAVKHRFCFDTGHLLIWRETSGSLSKADREIERELPEFAKHVKVFHFQANDGILDAHVTPFSTDFLDHPSRARLDRAKFVANFQVLEDWITTCETTSHLPERQFFLEAATHPFSLQQYVTFGKCLRGLLMEGR